MRLQEFRRYFKREISAWTITDEWVMFKPCELWNEKTDETIKFKKLDDSFDFVIDGKTILEHIEEFKGQPLILNGGRGAGSGAEKTFRFNSANDGKSGGGKPEKIHNAYLNVGVKGNMTLEGAMDRFGDRYRNAKIEYGAVVDMRGFAHQHTTDNHPSQVGVWGGKGQVVLHNHPSGGNFSKADMQSVSRSAEKGIVAVGKKGDYVFLKNHNFKGKEFEKAMSRARPKGKNYSEAVGNWLTANQKEYGYTYYFRALKK